MHISKSIFSFWGLTGIFLHDLHLKETPYLCYAITLCSSEAQPLSETGCFTVGVARDEPALFSSQKLPLSRPTADMEVTYVNEP